MLAQLTHTWNKCRWVEIFNLKSWEKMKYTTRNNFKSNRTLNNQIFKQVEAHSVEFYTNKFEIPLKIKESESEDWSWNFSMLSERALYVKERRRRRSEEVGKIIKSAIMILQETTFLMFNAYHQIVIGFWHCFSVSVIKISTREWSSTTNTTKHVLKARPKRTP